MSWTREATARLGNVSVIGILDDAPVDYHSQIAWVAHHEVMLAGLRNAGIGPVDAVFSSEAYGQELADRFAAVCMLDDLERQRVPMSATMARTDPSAHWHMVSEPARRDLARRFIVVGAESTETTTLTDELLEHYRARYPSLQRVDEYGREYTYALFAESQAASLAAGTPPATFDELVWTTSHFAHIAATQTARENAAALACPLVIADTDAFATSIWERRYVGPDSHGAADAAGASLPRRDLYLVTDHVDVPFTQDGWRDGEHIRASMTGWFIDGLTARGLPWMLLHGSHASRLAYAIEAIDGLLSAPPTVSRN